jgi:VanZ family protein
MPASRWLRAWLPFLFWAGIIWILSTSYFSAEHTGALIKPILHWLFPTLSGVQLSLIHHYIRKSAHVAEYFVFALLLFRGLRREAKGWRWSWALATFSLSAGYAILDEVHQSFVAGRVASLRDSLYDSIGALSAMIFAWLWFRVRLPRPSPQAAAPDRPPSA